MVREIFYDMSHFFFELLIDELIFACNMYSELA